MNFAIMTAFRWLLGFAQVKAVMAMVISALLAFALAIVTNLIASFINPAAIQAAFASIDPAVWYFINLFNVLYGIPIIIGAFITRFLIRRIPFIG